MNMRAELLGHSTPDTCVSNSHMYIYPRPWMYVHRSTPPMHVHMYNHMLAYSHVCAQAYVNTCTHVRVHPTCTHMSHMYIYT